MNHQTQDSAMSQAAGASNLKRDTGYFLYRKCMYCGMVFGTTPCEKPMHEKVSHGICPNCANCGAFAPLMPVEENCA